MISLQENKEPKEANLICLQSYAKKTSYGPCVLLFFKMLGSCGNFVNLRWKNKAFLVSLHIFQYFVRGV